MILISRRVDYGLLALHHLVQNPAGASAREIAERFNLSRPFIANILKALCHEDLIEGHRGVHGGYKLIKPADEVTFEMIVTALDGPFKLMSCADDAHPDTERAIEGDGESPPTMEEACGIAAICPVRSPLRMVHDKLLATLREVTLADISREAARETVPALVSISMES